MPCLGLGSMIALAWIVGATIDWIMQNYVKMLENIMYYLEKIK